MQNLLRPLKQLLLITISTIATSSAVTYSSQAQTFTNVPNDSIVATSPMDVEVHYNIVQQNIYPDTIFLHWEKVSAIVPDQWSALVCDNNLCYNGLIQSGNMDSMFQNHDGLLSVYLTPHENPGTAIIHYAVWDIANPSLKDTLTWVITAWPTGINSLNQNSINVFVSGNELAVLQKNPQLTHLRVCNLEGRTLLKTSFTSNKMIFDVSNFPPGIYFVEATGTNTIFTRKIFIQ